MLCDTCENLPAPVNVAGTCAKCQAHTAYFAYKLCDDCSDEMDQCERCEAPLDATAASLMKQSQPVSTALSIVVTDQDKDSKQTGMHPGERIVVRLEEDQYSQTEWGPQGTNGGYMFSLVANNGFVPYQGQHQKGTRELIFEIVGTGTHDLILEEKVRVYSWYGYSGSSRHNTVPQPAPNGRTFKVTVESN